LKREHSFCVGSLLLSLTSDRTLASLTEKVSDLDVLVQDQLLLLRS
jgi:hypothetical protein